MKRTIENNFNQLIPQLEPIEADRKKANTLILIIRFITAPIILLAVYHIFKNINTFSNNELKNSVSFLFTFIFTQELIVINTIKNRVNRKFKRLVMPTIVKILDNSFSYSINSNKPTDSTILNMLKDSNRVSSEDYIEGTLNGVNVEFKEMYVAKKTGSGKNSHTEVIFEGQCYTLSFNKPIPTPLLITTRPEKISPSILRTNSIELEDIQFNKLFNIYCNDEIMSRYILSPQFMDRLKTLTKLKYTKNVHAYFTGENLYIAVESSKNMFELNTRKSVLDINNYSNMTEDFLIIDTIIEELKLADTLRR